jgi:hypothetical protein
MFRHKSCLAENTHIQWTSIREVICVALHILFQAQAACAFTFFGRSANAGASNFEMHLIYNNSFVCKPASHANGVQCISVTRFIISKISISYVQVPEIDIHKLQTRRLKVVFSRIDQKMTHTSFGFV